MKTLYFKSFIVSTCLVLASFLVLGIAFVILGRGVLVNERKESMEATAKVVASTASAYNVSEQPVYPPWYAGNEQDYSSDWRSLNLRVLLTTISTVAGHHVFICDEDGIVVNCSDTPGTCPHINHHLSPTMLSALERDGKLSGITDLGGLLGNLCYVAAIPIYSADGSTFLDGYAFAAADSSSLIDTWSTFLSLFSATAVLILLMAMVMSYLTSKRMAKPLNEMTAASRRFSHGDFSARVTDDGFREDELGELTTAFNVMADSLEKSDELKRDFIANVSHELKTPMTTIAGFADGILDGTIPKEGQDQYLMTISSETKRLSRLVKGMLEISQMQEAAPLELKKQSFDISEVLCQTLINFENRITERGLDVNALLPENSIIVLGSIDAITQVVYNLLDNAVKFADPGSAISLSLWKQGRKAYVSVKNTGPSIPEEQLPLIFDRFHKTDRSRSEDRDGVGLGLYIVKSILNNHNEDISVSSRAGVTEFVFSLSLLAEKQPVKQKPE